MNSVFGSSATTCAAFANTSVGLTLGNSSGMTTILGDLTIAGYDLTFGPTSDTTRQTINSPLANTISAVYTLPNVDGGNIVIANNTNFNSDNYILVGTASASSTTPPIFRDPENVVVGGVFFRNETNTTTTRYPIAFLGNNLSDESTFGTIPTDSTKVTGYIKTNWSVTDPLGSTSVGNASYGLMYEVGNGTGTLYCDYIGATLDCGTY